MDMTRARGRGRRKGVVLVLILGMLGLLALIGVTFATFSGQAQLAARDAAQSVNAIPSEAIFDFGLSQLINDTDSPSSAIRGHSLKRDMYGNDAVNNVHLTRLPDPLSQSLYVVGTTQAPASPTDKKPYIITTNIPTNNNSLIRNAPSLYNANFAGCVLRLQQWVCRSDANFTPLNAVKRPDRLTQTFEIVNDDSSGQYHAFTLTFADLSTTVTKLDGTDLGVQAFVQPDSGAPAGYPIATGQVLKNLFEIDGRYMRAFNGTGHNPTRIGAVDLYAVDNWGAKRPYSAYPNFLYNRLNPTTYVPSGLNDPNTGAFHMDEDYDSADNENWYLALKNADGSVMIPSFHRPGNLIYNPNKPATENDWTNTTNPARAKFLRPRKVDHPQSGDTFKDLIPDAATGRITYDVDNDGDGVTDSVWVDLGYPVQRDPNGKLFKPLFAFMVLGLNGRLPLNTAGNLQKRDTAGTPIASHASHIGYSVNEINPAYALTPTNPVYDTTLSAMRPSSGPGDGLLSMQLILQGNPGRTAAPVPPTEGRFGEVGLITASNGTRFPRAGRSYIPNTYTGVSDYFDVDFGETDFYPRVDSSGNAMHPETLDDTAPTTDDRYWTADMLDQAGRQVLPVERVRRFVTPIDISGNGRLVERDKQPAGDLDYGLGFDLRGRLSYFLYFRPPGISNWRGPGAKPAVDPTDITKNTLNVLHGYESFRNPEGNYRTLMAMMPWDNGSVNANGTKIWRSGDPLPAYGTFTGDINTAPTAPNEGTLTGGNLSLNEASQLNLYEITPFDSPFGLADQEWLNRKGDVDDSGLSSRLSTLGDQNNLQDYAPYNASVPLQTAVASYKNPLTTDANAAVKRGLFSVESWDLNRWSAPVGTMGGLFGVPAFDTTQHFSGTGTLPALMHGGQRINLNLPLPVSDNPTEATRIKWCRDAYQMMKCVLYPPYGKFLADGVTPVPAEDLAAIGQYVVNIVDFRDPDATMTRFNNYDIVIKPPVLKTLAPGDPTSGSFAGPVIDQPAGVALAPAGVPNTTPVAQWGMEYNPIAITEILAFQSFYKATDGNGNETTTLLPRMFVELVNTLSQGDGKSAVASNLDLYGWGFVITQDDPRATQPTDGMTGRVERPNTATGQLDAKTVDDYFVPLKGTGKGSASATYGHFPSDALVKAINGANPDYYVLANQPPAVTGYQLEKNKPTYTDVSKVKLEKELIDQIPLTHATATLKPKAEADYYWLHLLRPANPNAADMTKEPKVVVDSFRFPYIVDDGQVTQTGTPPMRTETVQRGGNAIYSTRRLQPYRGAHFVPRSDHFGPSNPYGYTEQTLASGYSLNGLNGSGLPDWVLGNETNYQIQYDADKNGSSTPTTLTAKIYHSLDKSGGSQGDDWEHLAFHDRDFQSVAELLLVPACPPGLFTKLFAELPAPRLERDSPTNFDVPAPSVDATTVRYESPPLSGDPPKPDVYAHNKTGVMPLPNLPALPYLPEAFYYSQGSKSGWHKVLEYFEVPSTALGYIGPVAAGQNADWARRDLRPGLLNLNLIVDDEVFFGLIDDPRLNTNPTPGTAANLPAPGTTTAAPIGIVGAPQYATAIYPTGMPSYAAPVANRGFPHTKASGNNSVMKVAFADFLKLRDGGSGLVFSPFSTSPFAFLWGAQGSEIALPSRPFRSLSNRYIYNNNANAFDFHFNVDVNDTVLRPARLPAFQVSSGNADLGIRRDVSPPPNQDPLTPRIAPRRLFQVPDADMKSIYAADPVAASNIPNDPAAEFNQANSTSNDHAFLANTNASLFTDTVYTDTTQNPAVDRHGYLGASTQNADPDPKKWVPDHRPHPVFRTEMLSKVMNQTTIRTHQYAVWVTVGFFEVVKPGNPQRAAYYDPDGVSQAVDRLGKEVGADTGKNVRYRSYYLIDRTKATGFNPYEPGDFRDLITFRRRIE